MVPQGLPWNNTWAIALGRDLAQGRRDWRSSRSRTWNTSSGEDAPLQEG